MARSITQHTAFVVEEHSIVSCLRRLDNAGPWLAFDGGVGGQKANMWVKYLLNHLQNN